MKGYLKRTRHWIVLLLFTDLVFIFSTWIIRREAIRYMALFFLLFTALILAVGFCLELYKRRRDEAALLQFLETPDDRGLERISERFGYSEAVRRLCARILSDQALLNEKTVELSEYQDYIEAWVHEMKTSLSLSTLVMSNHKEEMSPYVYARLHYARHQITDHVERILFYARMQADHPDLRFTRFRLDECVAEVLDEHLPFIEEKKILLTPELYPSEVISDRKTVSFIVSQLVGNAVKYADGSDGRISVTVKQEEDQVCFVICNNGDGVPPEDMPFIFDKGFTGNYPNRQKATGMGLYLAYKYAEKLCVRLRADIRIPYEKGFGMEMIFRL